MNALGIATRMGGDPSKSGLRPAKQDRAHSLQGQGSAQNGLRRELNNNLDKTDKGEENELCDTGSAGSALRLYSCLWLHAQLHFARGNQRERSFGGFAGGMIPLSRDPGEASS